MTTDQIRYFLEIEKYNSFTEAAQHLHMNQSSLSRQIAELEKELDAELFLRLNRGLELTESGRLFKSEGIEILRKYEAIRERITMMGKGREGILLVGLPVNIFGVTKNINGVDIVSSFPQVDIKFKMMGIDEINTALLRGDIDIGFTFEFAVKNHLEELEYKTIFSKPFIFFTARHRVGNTADLIGYDDFLDTPLLLLDTAYQPEFLLRMAGRLKSKGKQTLSFCSNYETILMEASLGRGIGILPGTLFEQAREGYELAELRFRDMDTEVNYILAYHKDNTNPSIRTFCRNYIDCLHQ